MAGISYSAADVATRWLPPEPPATEFHAGVGTDDDTDNDNNTDNNAVSPLLDLVERFPDLFEREVLRRVDPVDRTFLAQAGGVCLAAVAASDLPRAGTREEVLGKSVWVVTHRLRDFVGSVRRLAWAKSSGCPWVAQTCQLVASGGRLEVLQWAREHSCPWDVWNVCKDAARGGHLEMLRWARENHCPWNDYTTFWAAARGHLEMLRWARENGCPWDKDACEDVSWERPGTQAWVRGQP
jgi:hypothetical protein